MEDATLYMCESLSTDIIFLILPDTVYCKWVNPSWINPERVKLVKPMEYALVIARNQLKEIVE